MQTRLLFVIGILFFLLGMHGEAIAQSSSTASQDQAINNVQELVSGNQTITFPSSTPIRGFAIPGNNPLPPTLPTPSHFAPPVTDGNYGSIIGMLAYKNLYTMTDADELLKNGGKMRVLTTCYLHESVREPKYLLRIYPDPKEKDKLRQQYEIIGLGNYKSLDVDTVSEHVLGMAIKEGLNIGADIMTFQEGAALVQASKGWSIGLFNSLSYSSNTHSGEGYGNVAVGGLGYGRGETGYASKPWLRVMFFRERSAPIDQRLNETSGKQIPGNKKGVSEFEKTLKEMKEPTPEEKFLQTQPR